MNNKLKQAFDEVHAEDHLKRATRQFLLNKTNGYMEKKISMLKPKYLVPVMSCFLFILIGLGGYWAYFVPTSIISIDVNPSVELGINRFDKVISVQGYNEDGHALAATLDIKFMNYTDALNEILSSENISDYLLSDEILSISVVGANEEHSNEMLANVETCAAKQKNVYCYSASADQVEAAHAAGLTCGKYQAFLELQALDPDITTEAIQGMTMREIQNMINSLSGENTQESQPTCTDGESNSQSWGQGYGGGNGNGQGKGQGLGYGQGHGQHNR